MPAPFSQGLSAFAPIMNRQGLSSSMSMPRPMARPAPAPRPAPMPRRPTQTFAPPRPGAMQMPQQANPFAGFQQPMPAPQPMLPPQPFNSYPNPTAGAGAGQMPMGKQMLTPQQIQPGFPTPGQIYQQPNTKQMLTPQQVQPGFPTPGDSGLNPDIMFAPVPQQAQPTPKYPGPPGLLQQPGQLPQPTMDDLMFGPDENGVVGTGRPVGFAKGSSSLFNPGSFKM